MTQEDKQKVWAFLLDTGDVIERNKIFPSTTFKPLTKQCLGKVLGYGINWDLTAIPDIYTSTEYVDPFESLCMEGYLYLNNGDYYTWIFTSTGIPGTMTSNTEIETIIVNRLRTLI